jgi:hypothetical protein
MKKTIYLFASAITLLLAFNSCKSNDTSNQDETLSFSTQTVEQQKQTIEQNGIDLVNAMDGIQNTKAMIALKVFSNIIGTSSESPVFVKPLSQFRTNILKNDVNALEKLNNQLRVAATVGSGFWGVWTWNAKNDDFDYVAGTDGSATILFPATENSSVNTGELKITYVNSSVVVPKIDEVEFLPKSISVVLKVSGVVALQADYSGSFKTDATPINITQTLSIGDYNWSLVFTNDDKDVSAIYTLNSGSKVLLKYEVGAAGSFTASNIEDSMDNDKPENVLTSGAMSFQIMNIAFKGSIADFKGFVNADDSLEINYDSKSSYQKEADLMNNYLKMYGYFVNEKTKFADIQFYVYDDSYTYVWNNTKYTEYNYSLEPRLLLSDGSAITINDYVKTGFEDLITQVKSY